MDNNQLDKYFKENSHRFDEQPGDDLWAKIEGGLNAAPAPVSGKDMGKGGLFSGKWLLLLVACIAGIGMLAVLFMPTETSVRVEQPLPKLPHKESIIAFKDTASTIVDTVKKQKIYINRHTKNPAVRQEDVVPGPVADSVVKPYTVTRAQQPEQALVPMQRKIKVSIQESAKRTVINIREKISQQKFDSITAASLEQYKDKAGMQLIIKSVQGYVYRYTFPKVEKQYPLDVITTKPKNKLAVTTKIITVTDSITTESVAFRPKYDSLTDTYYVQYGKHDISQQEPVYTTQLTVQPEFPGGFTELFSFINKTFRYPETVKNLNAKVHVSFIIETDGSISNIKVLKDPGYGLGAEAVRVLKLLTIKWRPGEVNGKAVRTAYFMPIAVKIK